MDENPEFYYPDELEDDLDLANATAVFESQISNNNNNTNPGNNKDGDEEMISKFLNAQKSRNTEYKTKSDMKTWQRFCQSSG